MKLNLSNKKNRALTLVEVLMVVACVLILAALSLAMLTLLKHGSARLGCLSNIEDVNLAFRIWEGDNKNQYPMAVSVTNKGAMELIQTGNVATVFQVMSNELTTTKILVCPDDPDRSFATNWNELNASHISYFVNPDVTNGDNSKMILAGDDNFLVRGAPVKSGLSEFSSNSPIAWSEKRHRYAGNLGFADGSVQAESQSGLQQAFQEAGLATNRIVIP